MVKFSNEICSLEVELWSRILTSIMHYYCLLLLYRKLSSVKFAGSGVQLQGLSLGNKWPGSRPGPTGNPLYLGTGWNGAAGNPGGDLLPPLLDQDPDHDQANQAQQEVSHHVKDPHYTLTSNFLILSRSHGQLKHIRQPPIQECRAIA